MNISPIESVRVGPFTFDPRAMVLACGDQPVRLGARAINLLAVLIEARGGLVTRQALLDRVWPGQAIEESALRVHLSAARKALAEAGADDNAIVNEPGRGYRLTLPVTAAAAAPVDLAVLPTRTTAIHGREATIRDLSDEVLAHRFLSVVGAGGIGKTTVAQAMARHLMTAHGLRPCVVDLAPLSDPALVSVRLATALGVQGPAEARMAAIAAQLSAAPTLLLFDNCEHMIDAVADAVEALLERVDDLHVLVTSREPLRAAGEWVHRLAPLALPEGDTLEAFDVAAVNLFVERARAIGVAIPRDVASLSLVAAICRQLDGLPLAIELAAARCDAFDLATIAAALDDRFALLTQGRRTALPRHRTLRATLDWSYDLLSDEGRDVLDRLALFRGGFDAAGARGLLEGAPRVLAVLADLVGKSLVVSQAGTGGMRYRLLDTTRYYGLARLDEREGALRATRLAMARYLIAGISGSSAAWEGGMLRGYLAAAARHIDDVRATLDWAFAADGDANTGLALLTASAPLWFHLSLAREFLRHAEHALARIDGADNALQVELLNSYGHALWHTRGPVTEMGAAFARAQQLAEAMADEALAVRSLWGVWAHAILAGDYALSRDHAEHFECRIGPAADLASRQTALHMRALTEHFLGRQAEARTLLEAVLAGDAEPERATHANHAQVDGKIAALSLLMRIEWQQGDADTALALARGNAADALDLGHALSICYGLAIGAIPVAIACGAREDAATWTAALDRTARLHDLDHWHRFAVGYGAALAGTAAIPDGASAMQREMFAVAAERESAIPTRIVPFTPLHTS